jgi:ABC-type multidrug transport system ATPase subunit
VARDSQLWLLDEPHAGLDAAGRDVVDELVAGAARRGATVVVVSHELDRAAAMAGRSVAIVGGRNAGATGTDASVARTATSAIAPSTTSSARSTPEAAGVA